MIDILVYILGFILTIFFIVGIHELGHFIMARSLGIQVLRFSIGFGKTLLRWQDKKGTEYIFAAIPLGGYVKMLDETEGAVSPDQLHFAYNRQPLYKKIAVVLAGPLFNFLFAFILYWVLFVVGFVTLAPLIGKVAPHSIAANAGLRPQEEIVSINHQPISSWASVIIRLMTYIGENDKILIETKSHPSLNAQHYTLDLATWKMDSLKPDPLSSLGIEPYEPEVPAIIGKIFPDTPAAHSSLREGDKVLSIGKQHTTDWLQAVKIIAENPDKNLPFTIKRDGKTMTFMVDIGNKKDLLGKKHGFLGLASTFEWPKDLLRHNQYAPGPAVSHALQNTKDFILLNFILLGKVITGKVSLQSLGGPITIFESAGNALNTGALPFLNFLAFLSIAIGVINVLPIPGLDGGHLLFYLIEAITRRPLSLPMQNLFFRLGFILLLLLLVQAIVNDIMRL